MKRFVLIFLITLTICCYISFYICEKVDKMQENFQKVQDDYNKKLHNSF